MIDRSKLPLYLSLLFAVGCLMLSMVGNEDLWWYLASGNEILDRLAIPDRDPFLFSSGATETWVTTSREQVTWVNHSWLWTVVLAALHRGFGPPALAIFAALSVGGFVTLLFTQGRLDRFGLINGLVTAAVLYACIDRFALRAEMAGWLLFSVYTVLLEKRRPFGFGRFALFAALQWFWANLHGSYVLGLAVAFAYAIGDFAQRRIGSSRQDTGSKTDARPPVPLWLGPALCVVSVAMPKLGAERVLDALAFLSQLVSSTAGSYATPIEEWQGTFSAGLSIWSVRYAAIAGIGLLGFGVAQRPTSIARGFVFVGMGVLAVTAIRFIAGFAIATGLITLWNLSELRPNFQRWLSSIGRKTLAVQRVSTALLGALLIGVALASSISRSALEVGQSRDSWVTLHPQFTCPGAADYVRETGLVGPIFNDVGLGGYLIHALYPEHQLYIDTRNLSATVVEDYRGALSKPAHWRELDRRFGFRIAILSNSRVSVLPLRSLLATDPVWEIVYYDPQAVVFAKRVGVLPQPRFEPNGGVDGVPYLSDRGSSLRSWIPEQGAQLLARYLDALLELRQPEAAVALASAAMELQPEETYWLQARAVGRLQSGQPGLAAEDFARIVTRVPENTDARYRYALSLHRSGADSAALEVLAEVIATPPGHREANRLRREILDAQLDR